MTQEDKELLLKDLCARLPYGVICKRYENAYELVDIDIKRGLVYLLRDEQYVPYSIIYGDEIKPYLRPMSSIAELITAKEWSSLGGIDLIDWYNANHIDYRGLIEKGLALEASNGMYNINEK